MEDFWLKEMNHPIVIQWNVARHLLHRNIHVINATSHDFG